MKYMKYIKYILFQLIIFTFISGEAVMDDTKSELSKLLPNEIEGWAAEEPDNFYNKDNLYEYINGGAELYISYSFKECFARIFTKEGRPDIIVDIFDMGNSFNAFGIFTHSIEYIDDKYGQGSESSPNAIIFWKDHYFISIILSYEDKKAEKALKKLAKQVDENIKKNGTEPFILDLLSQKSLIKESIRYFHHHVWQNSYYFIADSNIFNINNTTEALLAKYKESDNRSLLLMIKYPENIEAQQVYNKYTTLHFPSSNIYQIVPSGTNYFKGCMLTNNVIAFVFKSRKEKHIQEIFKDIYMNIRKNE